MWIDALSFSLGAVTAHVKQAVLLRLMERTVSKAAIKALAGGNGEAGSSSKALAGGVSEAGSSKRAGGKQARGEPKEGGGKRPPAAKILRLMQLMPSKVGSGFLVIPGPSLVNAFRIFQLTRRQTTNGAPTANRVLILSTMVQPYVTANLMHRMPTERILSRRIAPVVFIHQLWK